MLWALVLVGAGAFWLLTLPNRLPAAEREGVTGDAEAGAYAFTAAGCANCHVAPDTVPGDAPVLSGGQAFASPFGTFHAPNISPDPVAGIGGWTEREIAQAILRGVTPEGAHLYPAFPYGSYIRGDVQGAHDIAAYLLTLPPSAEPSLAHELTFPFNNRRGVGLWKRLFLSDDWVLQGDLDPQVERGRYLVEAMSHCGECHTPRNALGAPDTSRWLAGGPVPGGEGNFPNITPAALGWSEAQIAEYLSSGFTPEFDTAGGAMVEVIQSTSRLTDEDRLAIAAYLKAVPPVE
ncbi:cytochrome c [Pseudoroseicyclus sp. CLL3-39]|uniref:Cytochrome c n=1 Tax=Pseudoroseicyclus tamaricis TaxID=2705421 RepID=A0A6B2JRK2_9RHOB|nr:cytochrome c [Pseudoroseicyclus tamaricis]